MRRRLTPIDRIVVKLQRRVVELERENAYLRAMSSSGFARGQIKTPPKTEWTPSPEEEDML